MHLLFKNINLFNKQPNIMQKNFSIYLTVFLTLLFYSPLLFSQAITNGFNFYLPPDDTAKSEFISLMPDKPIGSIGFVNVDQDGHFSINGERIRFWGTNLVAGGAFPPKNDAWFIAGRLRKMGFNLIRFHHMDNPWSSESLFIYGQDTRHLNPATLDNFEYLIFQLKKNGIYANINLNVSRNFNTKDGVAGADSVTNMFKGVTIFDPQLIYLEKEYARQLLLHRNPYTGLDLVNDPVMAMVEVINENSLVRMWHDNRLIPIKSGGDLLFRHSYMLDTLWNSFLTKKYKTRANLENAWNSGLNSTDTSNIIKHGDFENPFNPSSWYMELHETAQATMVRDSTTSNSGRYSEKVSVINVTPTNWYIQWEQTGFTLNKDTVYQIKFSAKADSSKKISLTVMRNNSPYTYYTGNEFNLTSQWKTFSFTFRAPEDNINNGRISFSFFNNGTFWFDDVTLNKIPIEGLLPEEDPGNKSVRRISYEDCARFSANRVKDMADFYIKLQTDFFLNMKSFLHDTLGVKVPITGTNWNIGASDLISQSVMDYIDNHSYWDHPNFPSVAWDTFDWYIQNQPMAKSSSGGTIPGLFGGVGMKGKPITVSEYNHAYPNIYQTEGVLFLAAYSSFHDVDGIMFFDYEGSSNSWNNDYINSYFDLDRNSAMMALMPSCSYAFRNGLVSQAKQTLYLNYTRDTVLILPKVDISYAPSYFSQKLALLHEVRNESFGSNFSSDFSALQKEINPPFISDTKEIEYNADGLLTVTAKNFIGITGLLEDFLAKQIKNLELKEADGFGTITWLSLTEDSLATTRKSLLTVTTIQQNTVMIWDGTATVHNNWGQTPTIISPLSVKLILNLKADSIKVYPLDEKGNKNPDKYYLIRGNNNYFNVSVNQNTDKTLWYGIETFGNGIVTGKNDGGFSAVKNYSLEQNFPNPFNPSTTINYSVPRSGYVSLKVFDVLGNMVADLVEEEVQAGRHSINFNASGTVNGGKTLSSGIYFYRLKAGGFSAAKKFILLK